MKKQVYLLAMIVGLSASTAFSMNSDPPKVSEDPVAPDLTENTLTEDPVNPVITENTLSEEEFNLLSLRVEEIRAMDKSTLTVEEKRELKKELKATKKNLKENSPYIVIGGTTLLLIIIIILLI
ncbi:MAG: hypothetical protein OQK81_03605 [Candidatus Bathyarchaeota archaeon]|nr:hypothetical protein [Candidatus Bathyarchaeota archaeon]